MSKAIDLLLKQVGEADAIVMSGLPGSGKSSVAKILAKHLGARIFASDDYRKKLFGDKRFSEKVTEEEHQRRSREAYAEMYQDVVTALGRGDKVIVDGTHLNGERGKALEILGERWRRLLIVKVICSDEVVYERAKHCPSDIEGETHSESLKRVRSIILDRIAAGHGSWPSEDIDHVPVVTWVNE